MAKKGPILGVVTCTAPGCSGDMQVRSRKAGRGGGVKLYGHCSECGHLEQKNSQQDHLKQCLSGDPLPQDDQTSMSFESSFTLDKTGFNQDEIEYLPDETTEETPINSPAKVKAKPSEPKRGGLLKWFIGGVTVVAAIAGVHHVVTR
jgi:hypothetical protein